MIRFSRREDYAVILVTKLAEHFGENPLSLSQVAREYNISLLFLRNLANDLRKKEIVGAVEGRKGGYFLKKDPKKLLMGEVLEAFSHAPVLLCCTIGMQSTTKAHCPKEAFCEPGFIWRRLNKEFFDKVSNLTISEFIRYQ